MSRTVKYLYVPLPGRTVRRKRVTSVLVRRVVVAVILILATAFGGAVGLTIAIMFMCWVGCKFYRRKSKAESVNPERPYVGM